MRTLNSILCMGLFFLFYTIQPNSLKAQETCEISQEHGQGYTTTISSVTENDDGTHTIVLIIENDGCWGCKSLKRYYVEADPGTYSDISVETLTGDFSYGAIYNGPFLGFIPFLGFKVYNIDGIGGGEAASFSLTYTLSGGLQNQKVMAKAGWYSLIRSYSAADFQSVLDCNDEPDDILPYYEPLDEGKSYDIIGSELTSLHDTYVETGTYISDDIFQVIGDNVVISIITQPGQYDNTLALLTTSNYGLNGQVGSPNNNLITGLYPIANLLLLNELPDLLISASPVYSALGNAGLITSQGDVSLRSGIARNVFDVNGEGVKIGVMSDSYNTILGNPAGDDVFKGDLPGGENPDFSNPVDVLSDYPYGTRTDEGRAMLQIVHDIAPGADLAFRTGFLGAVDFAEGIHELQAAGCDIIVDDITYISEPFFRDGVVAQAVDDVTALGVSYFSAAGNFGTRSWQGAFEPTAPPGDIVGEAHNFAFSEGGVDNSQSITLTEGQYTVVLQWDDGSPGNTTASDYDIYLADDDGSTLFGFNRVNTGGAPIEVLPFTVAAETAMSNFLIIRESGSGPAQLKYIIYRGDIQINEYATPGASTITGQANAEGAIAVGAVLYTNTPEYGVDGPTVASFSSRGGTPVNGVFRAKPELCAPNGVNTSVDLGGVNYEEDDFPNFFGTSAAAPHAAGVAALLIQARDKYYGDDLTPELVRGVLQNTALDMHSPGYDIQSGAGFILADSALINLANPTPYIDGLSYDTTLTPGIDEIWITIYGEYVGDESTVWFNGEEIEGESIVVGDTSISALIPPFEELYPELQVFNPPMTGTNGADGGLSNPLYFTTKQTVFVQVASEAKVFGEVLPEFSATYTIESLENSIDLESAGLSEEELDRIYGIGLTTIATPTSNVGLWGIEADSNDPLSPNSDVIAEDSLDLSLLQRFNFVFNNGLLTVSPLDLLISPRDTTFMYTDSITGLTFDYEFNEDPESGITIDDVDRMAIASAVSADHTATLAHRTVLVRGTALVNDLGELLLNETVLTNTSILVSRKITTTRGTALVNGELIAAEDFYTAASDPGAIANVVGGATMVRGFSLVRGTALVNDLDEDGNVVNTIPLVNSNSLVNSSALMNSTTINLESNSETLVILGDEDIAILSGDSIGNVEILSVNLITGETVGTHIWVPGTYLSNNFNISYGLGNITVVPAEVDFDLSIESLDQTYDGTPRPVVISTTPMDVAYSVTYDGSPNPPTDAGSYAVVVETTDENFVGSASATLVINPAIAQVFIDPGSLNQEYDGTGKSVFAATPEYPEALDIIITYDGELTLPIETGDYFVEATVDDPNYEGSATGTMIIGEAEAEILFDAESLSQLFDGTPKSVIASTAPEGLTLEITYDGGVEAPTGVGFYTVEAIVVDPNYIGTASAVLEINQAMAEIVFDESSLSQDYDGSPKSVIVSSLPEGLVIDITYNGSAELPINTGTYAVEATVNDLAYGGSATATLVINQTAAEVVFDAESLEQVYDGLAKSASASTLPAGLAISILYDGEELLPIDAGSYTVEASVLDDNYTGVASDILVINPASAQVIFDAESLSQGYDGSPKSVGVSTVPAGLAYSISYNGDSTLPVDAGTYAVEVVITESNYMGEGSVVMEIINLTATVSTGTYLIDEGDDLPEFMASYEGFVNGDDESVITSLNFELSPTYDGEAGVYELIPTAEAPGYSFASTSGTLYVNPSGYGTREIRPQFLCYEWLEEPDENGFQIIANFQYKNLNSTPVYIPVGEKNEFFYANHDNSEQPELFLPGTHVVSIPYDGGWFGWKVTSNKNNGTRTKYAYVWFNECDKSNDSNSLEAGSGEAPEIVVYPNPSTGKVFLQFEREIQSAENIEVYDHLGRKCLISPTNTSEHVVEIDLSTFSKGIYIIRIIGGAKIESHKVVIE